MVLLPLELGRLFLRRQSHLFSALGGLKMLRLAGGDRHEV